MNEASDQSIKKTISTIHEIISKISKSGEHYNSQLFNMIKISDTPYNELTKNPKAEFFSIWERHFQSIQNSSEYDQQHLLSFNKGHLGSELKGIQNHLDE